MSKGGQKTTQDTNTTSNQNSTGSNWGTQNGFTNGSNWGASGTNVDPTVLQYRDKMFGMFDSIMGGANGAPAGGGGGGGFGGGGGNYGLDSYAKYADQGQRAMSGDAAAVQQYMNPYLDQVLGRVNAGADKLRAGAMNQVDDAAAQAHAFGGSRHGIAMGQAIGDTNNHLLDTQAQLSSQGFNEAMQRALGQANLGLGAGSAMMQRDASMANASAQVQAAQIAAGDPRLRAMEAASRIFGTAAQYGNTTNWQAGGQDGTYGNNTFGGNTQNTTGTQNQHTVETKPGGSMLGGILGLGTTLLGLPGVGSAIGGMLGGKITGLLGGGNRGGGFLPDAQSGSW